MSKSLSLKLRDAIFEEMEEIRRKTNTPRNAYINNAIVFYNKKVKREILRKQIAKESHEVREGSLEVLREFEMLQDDIPGLD